LAQGAPGYFQRRDSSGVDFLAYFYGIALAKYSPLITDRSEPKKTSKRKTVGLFKPQY